jgi:hypothetical protein
LLSLVSSRKISDSMLKSGRASDAAGGALKVVEENRL